MKLVQQQGNDKPFTIKPLLDYFVCGEICDYETGRLAEPLEYSVSIRNKPLSAISNSSTCKAFKNRSSILSSYFICGTCWLIPLLNIMQRTVGLSNPSQILISDHHDSIVHDLEWLQNIIISFPFVNLHGSERRAFVSIPTLTFLWRGCFWDIYSWCVRVHMTTLEMTWYERELGVVPRSLPVSHHLLNEHTLIPVAC